MTHFDIVACGVSVERWRHSDRISFSAIFPFGTNSPIRARTPMAELPTILAFSSIMGRGYLFHYSLPP